MPVTTVSSARRPSPPAELGSARKEIVFKEPSIPKRIFARQMNGGHEDSRRETIGIRIGDPSHHDTLTLAQRKNLPDVGDAPTSVLKAENRLARDGVYAAVARRVPPRLVPAVGELRGQLNAARNQKDEKISSMEIQLAEMRRKMTEGGVTALEQKIESQRKMLIGAGLAGVVGVFLAYKAGGASGGSE